MTSASSSILTENKLYWTGRAGGYSRVNQEELAGRGRDRWKQCLREGITGHFPGKRPEDLHVLEAGTGPGFFAILLCEMGFHVTAVDLTPAMLTRARQNAGVLAGQITFLEMNAEQLDFADEEFDVVISRNLTWNLPHPQLAYAEWNRVLKPGGLIMNFDANWYAYLFDEAAQAAYEADRANTRKHGIRDENVGDNFDVMENIARRVPLSRIRRPAWDMEQLTALGMQAAGDETVWQRVWSEEEKLNFASTPMFLVKAFKV